MTHSDTCGRGPASLRADFPILARSVYGHPLVYLDNGATTQKPRCVVDAMTDEYLNVNANVHRGVHYLSQQATDLMEQARERVRRFVRAAKVEEVVFTRGTTESINLVASSYTQAFLREGDEVVLTQMEHHSNIVPWQLMRDRYGIRLRVCPVTDDGRLDLDALAGLLGERTRLVCVTAVSNVLGTVNPVARIARMAHACGAHILVDAAQAAPHLPIDVQAMDCDFLALSGHKVYGPTGIGVLYGREELLEQMPPYMGGGEMIGTVSFEHTTFNRLPYKFEAGTPDYVAATGLARAMDYVEAAGMEAIMEHEHDLTLYALQRLRQVEGMRIFGYGSLPAAPTAAWPETGGAGSVVSFLVGGIHHLDMGTLLDRLGIAVRTGHHCAEPLMRRLGVEGTVRASFALYNTRSEVDTLAAGIERVARMF